MPRPPARKPKFQSSSENLEKARAALEAKRAMDAKAKAEKEAEKAQKLQNLQAQVGGCPGPMPEQGLEEQYEPNFDESEDSGDDEIVLTTKKGRDKGPNPYEAMTIAQLAKDIKKLVKLQKQETQRKALKYQAKGQGSLQAQPAPVTPAHIPAPVQQSGPAPSYGVGAVPLQGAPVPQGDTYIHYLLRNSLKF